MSHYLQHPEFYNKPIRLSEEYKSNPVAFLARFFGDYNLTDLRHFQAEILQACLTTNEPPFHDPGKRADTILLHKNFELLFESAFLIVKNRQADATNNQ